MESKKTFGEYICRRRKELGLTQREFADQLYVTESAVSKWERGMSYPDITLLRSICEVLGISEHELLTASEDTEKRTAERLAAKYLRLTRTYRAVLYLVFGAALLSCAIVNLAVQHTLDWFWIVLTGIMIAASLTLAPSLANRHPALEHRKGTFCIGCAAVSLVLLLLSCCLYTGGDWFWMAAVSVVFGLSLLFFPVFLRQLPLPDFLSRCKTTLYLGAETVLLLLLLLTGCLYTGGDWFAVAAVSVLFGLGLALLPVPLRQLPLPDELKRHKTLLYFAVETLLLLLLLGTAAWYTGGGWLFTQGLPIALVCLTLPWGLMGIIRYLPVNGWFRSSLSCAWTGLWAWLSPWALDRIMLANGWTADQPYRLRIPFDFSRWGAYVVRSDDGWEYLSYGVVANNIVVLILLSLGVLALAFAAVGVWRSVRRSPSPQ